jgi:putative membrane protein
MKTNILTSLIAVTLLTGATAPVILAVEPAAPATVTDAAADGRFIETSALFGWGEIKYSGLAKDRTKREDVKGFATAMVNDHKEMDKQLITLADKLNVQLPKDITAEQDAIYTQLKNANDGDFDRMYMDTIVLDHRKAVTAFEDASKNTKHADVKAFADANLPHMKTHLVKAEELAKLLGSIAAK